MTTLASPPPAVPDAFLDALTRIVGPAHVLTDADDLALHLREERGIWQGRAVALVRPGSTAEVAEVAKACAASRVPVVPHGGNTGLVGAGVPFGGIVLSLARMNRVRAVDPLNATMTVEAGCVLADVQQAAADHGLLFPLSLPSEGSCRIGGNLATNAGGTAVLRYGNARELMLGLEVVLADGQVWNGLKGLRKDNTGYDLRHLFVGSEGTLGIITAAVLKLFPAVRAQATAFIGCGSTEAALAVFSRLRAEAGESLVAFEYLPRFALEIVLKHAPDAAKPLAEAHHSYALIELASPRGDADLTGMLETILSQEIEAGRLEDATITASEAQRNALWLLRERISETQRFEGGSIKHDVSVPVSRVAEFIETAGAACRAVMPGARPLGFGHVGDGNIHFNISQPVGMERAEFLAAWERFNEVVHGIVQGMDGSISAEHGIGLLKRDELPHYKDPVALDLMARIKGVLDPQNILNPGKVLRIGDDLPPAIPLGKTG
ncbi:FAD-binding oxidoreductase [Enterovirga rhinocerotis]|uniref:FAD/FMN-containing dehydrogenase n=1 Tax=Enterovirga rhinocerotis TaxID=1339210 RepID=A0A4R7BX54_9HYPH|nr:FAD-binding oxidoreductase [Enterovirga rhinocerotis]TDR90161.1 FAD/FMN-containing dehydrogenase [Enterovirga rhinocerotis]